VGLLVLGLALTATLLRQEGVPKWRTIWAEDGTVFASCAYERPLSDCLLEPYAGYLHVVPRVAAAIAASGDEAGLPLRLAFLAGLIAGAAAILVALAVLDVTRSMPAGILAGAGLVLIDPAGVEVLGNLANLHWVLLAASVVVVVCMWLGRAPSVADLALLVATALSSPVGALVLVPMAVVAVASGSPSGRMTLIVIAVASVVQIGAMVTQQRIESPGPTPTPRSMLGWVKDALVDSGWFGNRYPIANVAAIAAAVATLCVLALRRQTKPALAIAALGVVGLTILLARLYLAHASSSRYAYVAVALSVCAVALGSGLLASRVDGRRRTFLMAAMLVLVGAGFTMSFRVPAYASTGPDVVQQLDGMRCATGTRIVVEISPRAWHMSIPCPDSLASA
jgi:hypothetical protein